MLITVVNRSTVVSDADVILMVAASNVLLPQVAKDWAQASPTIVFKPKTSTTPANWLFAIIDTDADQPDALAYHTENGDNVVGFILAKTILDNGGVALYKDATTPTVASALFHELAEAFIDPTCNAYWQKDDGTFVSAEVADPVQENIVAISIPDPVHAHKTITVGLSNYVLPPWRDVQATKAKFDHLGVLAGPFTMSAGGYMVTVAPGGDPQYVWGEMTPQWVKDWKQKQTSRAAKKARRGH
jgi:hypothetical protein